MIIVALENCEDCKKYKNLHPEYKYIVLGPNCKLSTEERVKLKQSLERLQWDKKVPVVIDEKMTQMIPRSKLIQELRIRTVKTRPCRNCGG